MKRSKRLKRRGRTCKSDAKAASSTSSQNADVSPVRSVPDFVLLPNAHDQFAIGKLRSAQVGCLEVDLFVRNDPELVALLRNALVAVYFRAAEARKLRRATQRQLSNATSALNCLKRAVQRVEAVSSDGRNGLRMLLEPVTGCTKISVGCDRCYAERFSKRFRGTLGHPFETGFDLTLRPERIEQPLLVVTPHDCRQLDERSLSQGDSQILPATANCVSQAPDTCGVKHRGNASRPLPSAARTNSAYGATHETLKAASAPWPKAQVTAGVGVEPIA